MAAGRTRLACVLRRYGQQHGAVSLNFVAELSPAFILALVEPGFHLKLPLLHEQNLLAQQIASVWAIF